VAEEITYYALRESGEPEATGLFRDRRIPSAVHLERIDRRGIWVRDNGLIDYLMGETGAERVSELEAERIARRLGGSTRRTAATKTHAAPAAALRPPESLWPPG